MTAAPPPPVVDVLLDLQHDLGKYLRMPLGFLAADADDAQVRQALRRALLETRASGGSVRSARALWQQACSEGGEALFALPGFAELDAAVQRALHWEHALEVSAPIDRRAAQRDFDAVAHAINHLLQTLQA